MLTIFKNELRRTRKGLLIWCLVAGLIAYLGILEYPMLAPYTAQMEQALSMIPKLGQLIFGVYRVDLTQALGYYIVMYYWTGLVVFTHAMYVGASAIMVEQRDKTAEFLFTKPHTRNAIVAAKILAGFFNIAVMAVVTISLSLVGMLGAAKGVALFRAVLLSGIGMFFTQALLMSIGFLCSGLCKTYKGGVMAAAALLVLSYCAMFGVQYADADNLSFLSPLTLFSVYDVTAKGIPLAAAALCALTVFFCLYFTHRLYKRKVMV